MLILGAPKTPEMGFRSRSKCEAHAPAAMRLVQERGRFTLANFTEKWSYARDVKARVQGEFAGNP